MKVDVVFFLEVFEYVVHYPDLAWLVFAYWNPEGVVLFLHYKTPFGFDNSCDVIFVYFHFTFEMWWGYLKFLVL